MPEKLRDIEQEKNNLKQQLDDLQAKILIEKKSIEDDEEKTWNLAELENQYQDVQQQLIQLQILELKTLRDQVALSITPESKDNKNNEKLTELLSKLEDKISSKLEVDTDSLDNQIKENEELLESIKQEIKQVESIVKEWLAAIWWKKMEYYKKLVDNYWFSPESALARIDAANKILNVDPSVWGLEGLLAKWILRLCWDERI